MNVRSQSVQASDALAWRVVALIGMLNLFRGSIHTFLPDGGAGVIAGFDLSHSRQTIVFLFAVMGIEQLSLGVVDLISAFRAMARDTNAVVPYAGANRSGNRVRVLQACPWASARHGRRAADACDSVAGNRMDLLATISLSASKSGGA